MFDRRRNNLFNLELLYNSRYNELKNYIRYIAEHDEADLEDLGIIYDDLSMLLSITESYMKIKIQNLR